MSQDRPMPQVRMSGDRTQLAWKWPGQSGWTVARYTPGTSARSTQSVSRPEIVEAWAGLVPDLVEQERDELLGLLAALVEAVGRGDEVGLPQAYRAAWQKVKSGDSDWVPEAATEVEVCSASGCGHPLGWHLWPWHGGGECKRCDCTKYLAGTGAEPPVEATVDGHPT